MGSVEHRVALGSGHRGVGVLELAVSGDGEHDEPLDLIRVLVEPASDETHLGVDTLLHTPDGRRIMFVVKT